MEQRGTVPRGKARRVPRNVPRNAPRIVPPLTPVWFLLLAMLAVELALSGADAGLWGHRLWRARAFLSFAFRPDLIGGPSALWPGQPGAMFLSHVFLHVGLLHMAGNVLSLVLLLRLLGWMRPWGFVTLGLVSALGGALAFWMLASGPASMTGASGAISGLAAFWAVRRLRQNPLRWQAVAAGLVLLLALAAAEFLPGLGTAWQAHLGGALVGALFGPTPARIWGGTAGREENGAAGDGPHARQG